MTRNERRKLDRYLAWSCRQAGVPVMTSRQLEQSKQGLEVIREAQRQQRIASSPWVFPNDKGDDPVTLEELDRDLAKACTRAGIPVVTSKQLEQAFHEWTDEQKTEFLEKIKPPGFLNRMEDRS